jgi:hypothetical protein
MIPIKGEPKSNTKKKKGQRRDERTEKKERKTERAKEEKGETEPREPKRKQTKTEGEEKSSIGQPARHRHPLRLQQRLKQVSHSSSPACKFNYPSPG